MGRYCVCYCFEKRIPFWSDVGWIPPTCRTVWYWRGLRWPCFTFPSSDTPDCRGRRGPEWPCTCTGWPVSNGFFGGGVSDWSSKADQVSHPHDLRHQLVHTWHHGSGPFGSPNGSQTSSWSDQGAASRRPMGRLGGRRLPDHDDRLIGLSETIPSWGSCLSGYWGTVSNETLANHNDSTMVLSCWVLNLEWFIHNWRQAGCGTKVMIHLGTRARLYVLSSEVESYNNRV